MKTRIIPLILLTLISCNDNDNLAEENTRELSIHPAKIEIASSRSTTDYSYLPDGSSLGLFIDDKDSYYQEKGVSNIEFIAHGERHNQTWVANNPVLLSERVGTVYVYWPYSPYIEDEQAVPVVAGRTDYLYATPVYGVNEGHSNVSLIMNHALAGIKFSIERAGYEGEGVVSDFSIQGKGLTEECLMNARTGELYNFSENNIISDKWQYKISDEVLDIYFLVPSTNIKAPITVSIIIDGDLYQAKVPDLQLIQSLFYHYHMYLTPEGLYVITFDTALEDWGEEEEFEVKW